MENCHYEVLLASSAGLATRCRGCGSIQVCYDCFMLVLSAGNFPVFREELRNTFKSRSTSGECRRTKGIFIKTPAKEVSLVFSLDELEAFLAFLERVEASMLVKKLAKEACLNRDPKVLN